MVLLGGQRNDPVLVYWSLITVQSHGDHGWNVPLGNDCYTHQESRNTMAANENLDVHLTYLEFIATIDLKNVM